MPGQTEDSDNIEHKTQNKDKQRPKKHNTAQETMTDE